MSDRRPSRDPMPIPTDFGIDGPHLQPTSRAAVVWACVALMAVVAFIALFAGAQGWFQ